jgi:Tfp pilus assembly protein PilF
VTITACADSAKTPTSTRELAVPRAAFDASLRANPRDVSTYVNAGMFSLQSGDPHAASQYFAEALAIDPLSAAARNGLAQAQSLLANPR